MKTYFYRRSNGNLVRIEADQMFWSGIVCAFVKNGLAAAVLTLEPGEIVYEHGMLAEVPAGSQVLESAKLN